MKARPLIGLRTARATVPCSRSRSSGPSSRRTLSPSWAASSPRCRWPCSLPPDRFRVADGPDLRSGVPALCAERGAAVGPRRPLLAASPAGRLRPAQIVGYGLGGLVLVWLPPRAALGTAAAAFVGSALLLRLGTRERAARMSGGGAVMRRSTASSALLLAEPRVRALLLMWWIPPMFFVVAEGVAAPFADAAGAGAAGFGVFLAAMHAGTMVSELLAGTLLGAAARDRVALPHATASRSRSRRCRCCRWPCSGCARPCRSAPRSSCRSHRHGEPARRAARRPEDRARGGEATCGTHRATGCPADAGHGQVISVESLAGRGGEVRLATSFQREPRNGGRGRPSRGAGRWGADVFRAPSAALPP